MNKNQIEKEKKMISRIYKDDGSGTTYRSLKYWKNQRWRIGNIIEIEMRCYGANSHPLRIKDDAGNEIWLSGCVSGYWGMGPSGTLKIVQEFRPKTTLSEIQYNFSFKIKKDKLGRFKFYKNCKNFAEKIKKL